MRRSCLAQPPLRLTIAMRNGVTSMLTPQSFDFLFPGETRPRSSTQLFPGETTGFDRELIRRFHCGLFDLFPGETRGPVPVLTVGPKRAIPQPTILCRKDKPTCLIIEVKATPLPFRETPQTGRGSIFSWWNRKEGPGLELVAYRILDDSRRGSGYPSTSSSGSPSFVRRNGSRIIRRKRVSLKLLCVWPS